jgi:hypothetical protein
MANSNKTIYLTLKQKLIIFFTGFYVKENKFVVIVDKTAQMMI